MELCRNNNACRRFAETIAEIPSVVARFQALADGLQQNGAATSPNF